LEMVIVVLLRDVFKASTGEAGRVEEDFDE
jgi:hypothetical protein